jgi:sulfonate transport system ATP-binding protein
VTAPVAVRVAGARKSFGARRILDDFDLDIHAGEFVALLGRSGSGKTTLLRVLLGLESLADGEVLVPRRRTVVFQEPRLLDSTRVLGNVLLGQRATGGRRKAAERALAEVGLQDHAEAWPSTLSGGEAQRVALARALVRDSALLLLDEPFAALDALTRLTMQGLVAEPCRRHQPAVLLVTHDVEEAILLADRIVVLGEGRVALDVRVDGPAVRRRDDPAFLALRTRLLGELGVPATV